MYIKNWSGKYNVFNKQGFKAREGLGIIHINVHSFLSKLDYNKSVGTTGTPWHFSGGLHKCTCFYTTDIVV